MADTFTQIHIHFVFAVKGRESLIHEQLRPEVEKYITGIVQRRKHKMLAIYCMPDHIHILIGKRPTQSESELMRDIKTNSSIFINETGRVKGRFSWQEGYGAFSHSKSQVNQVIQYILHQPIHHKKRSFREEYVSLLKQFEGEFDEKFLFQWIEADA